MKKLIFAIVFGVWSALGNAAILDKDEAFKFELNSGVDGLSAIFKIADGVYLYRDKFEFKINGNDVSALLDFPQSASEEGREIYRGEVRFFVPAGLARTFGEKIKFEARFQGCAQSGFCYQPMVKAYKVNLAKNEVKASKPDKPKHAKNESAAIADELEGANFALALLSFFGYGLLLALTPCVFPMIPIVASVVVAKCGNGNSNLNGVAEGGDLNLKPSAKKGFLIALIYVLAMSFAYAIAGVAAAFAGASLQGILQTPFVLIATALIFVLLALSMFDFYAIQMPERVQSFVAKRGEKASGYAGVAFLGFISALVVGPCVAAPLAGALLYIAGSGNAFFGGLALFVMSLGMGAPLLLVGLGAKVLPKPGFWMNEIKKIFGFLMLGMAVWILSRIVGEDVANLLYGVLCVFAAVFFGAFEASVGGARKFARACAIILLVFGAVMVANFAAGRFAPNLISNLNNSAAVGSNLNFAPVSNLKALDHAIKTAKKPVMLEITASWCENCKEMERTTFASPAVRAQLEKYTLLKADVSEMNNDNKALMSEFDVFGPPAFIFFEDGRELTHRRIIGFASEEKFLQIASRK